MVRKIFLIDAKVVLLFYESMNRQSFEKVKEFYHSYLCDKFKTNNVIYFIVRAKYDLNNKLNDNSEIINDEEVLEFANKYNMFFTHMSSTEKYETGIDNLFDQILSELIKLIKNKSE